MLTSSFLTEPQILPHEAEARQGAEAKQADPAVDSLEDREHHPVSARQLFFTTLDSQQKDFHAKLSF